MHSDSKGNMAEGDGYRDATAGIYQRFGRRNPNKEKPTGLTVEATDFPSSDLLTSQRGSATSDAKG